MKNWTICTFVQVCWIDWYCLLSGGVASVACSTGGVTVTNVTGGDQNINPEVLNCILDIYLIHKI